MVALVAVAKLKQLAPDPRFSAKSNDSGALVFVPSVIVKGVKAGDWPVVTKVGTMNENPKLSIWPEVVAKERVYISSARADTAKSAPRIIRVRSVRLRICSPGKQSSDHR
jgi:hypothetical protein